MLILCGIFQLRPLQCSGSIFWWRMLWTMGGKGTRRDCFSPSLTTMDGVSLNTELESSKTNPYLCWYVCSPFRSNTYHTSGSCIIGPYFIGYHVHRDTVLLQTPSFIIHEVRYVARVTMFVSLHSFQEFLGWAPTMSDISSNETRD